MISCIVWLISRLPDITQRTACTLIWLSWNSDILNSFAYISAPWYCTENCLYSKRSYTYRCHLSSEIRPIFVDWETKQKLRHIFFQTPCRLFRLGWLVHGHIGSNQMEQNFEPKTFFSKGKSCYLAEISECWVYRRKSCGYLIPQQLFEPVPTNIQ